MLDCEAAMAASTVPRVAGWVAAAWLAVASPAAAQEPAAVAQGQRAETVAYYLLDFEVTTTSDWAIVQLGEPGSILCSRQVGPPPANATCELFGGRLEIHQPIGHARMGRAVRVKLRVALAGAAGVAPLRVVLERGSLGQVTVVCSAESGQRLGLAMSAGSWPGASPTNRRLARIDVTALNMTTAHRQTLARPAVAKTAWAFYYPWYRLADWNSPQLRDRPAQRYSSDDPAAIRRHIEQAKGAGIGGFLCSWWGPGGPTDAAFAQLLAAAHELGFQATIYFETLDDRRPRAEQQLLDWLRTFLRTYRNAPALARLDGVPLIVLWASSKVERGVWQRIFDTLRREGLDARYIAMGSDPTLLDLFDGLHEYAVFTMPDLQERERLLRRATRYAPLLDAGARPTRLWCATVQPGYDDRSLPGRKGSHQERRQGAVYRATWEAALASDPDWVFITTWNEWWEHTSIEPGVREDDLYLRITRDYVDRWQRAAGSAPRRD